MQKVKRPRPAWAVEVLSKLLQLNLNIKDLAERMGITYQLVSSVLTGYITHLEVQEKILAAVAELEKGGD